MPTGNQVIDDRFTTGQPNYREFFYTTVNLAGESQNFDGNGAYLRLQPGTGDLTASQTDPTATSPRTRRSGRTRRCRRSALSRASARSRPTAPTSSASPTTSPTSTLASAPSARRARPRGAAAANRGARAAVSARETNGDAHWRAMLRRQLRGRFGDFLAVCALVIAGLAVTLGILSQQKASLPSWVPFFGQSFYHLDRRLHLGAGRDPGPGAGGDGGRDPDRQDRVRHVEDGHAVVGMDIEPEVRAADPSGRSAAPAPEDEPQRHGGRGRPGQAQRPAARRLEIPLSRTQANVNPDEFLSTLDADTRQYLTLLLQGGSEGIGGGRPRASSCRPSCAGSSRSPATPRSSPARSPSAARRSPGRARLPAPHGRARQPRRARSRASSTRRARRSAASPTSSRRSARRCANCRRPSTRRVAA